MDNNIQNPQNPQNQGHNEYRPQKPITEKGIAPEFIQNPVSATESKPSNDSNDFSDELVLGTPSRSDDDGYGEGFDKIFVTPETPLEEHYEFEQPAIPAPAKPVQNMAEQNRAAFYPQAPSISNYQAYPPVQNSPQQPNQGNNGNPQYSTVPDKNPQQQTADNYFPTTNILQPNPIKTKKKANGALIAIIIVLSALLLFGLGGIIFYLASNANIAATKNNNETNDQKSDNGYSFTIPGYTIPEITTPDDSQEEDTAHEESDYSDKKNPDYKGLKLEQPPKDADTSNKYNAASASSKLTDSVVGVICYKEKKDENSKISSQGSGIVFTEDGYVVTNSHVIGHSKTAYIIEVVTSDGKTYKAGVVGYDTRTDLAVLKMDNAKNLKPATFGDSDKALVGEDIIVIGNPGGLDFQNTTTKGVISAVNRDISSTSMVKYIQTDAPINPGNSGGPIANVYGQVIGIATSKIVVEAYEGMAFAIPSKDVKVIVDSLIKNSYVKNRVKIGIVGKACEATETTPAGIQIDEVVKGGPCDGKLKSYDIITEVGGKPIKSFSDVYNVLESYNPGDKVVVKYFRYSDNSSKNVEITLQEDVI